MYCVQKNCRVKTDNVPGSEVKEITKNGKNKMQATCAVCGGKKTTMIGGKVETEFQKGNGLFNDALNKLPLPEMHLQDLSTFPPKKYSFCGPFTNLDKRLKRNDGTPEGDQWHDWSKPRNELDKACYQHDIAYRNHSDTENRNKHDDILANKAKKIATNKSKTKSERANAKLVEKLIATKSRFGMGY